MAQPQGRYGQLRLVPEEETVRAFVMPNEVKDLAREGEICTTCNGPYNSQPASFAPLRMAGRAAAAPDRRLDGNRPVDIIEP